MSDATTWDGCYDGSWKGMIVDDAFAHPAKFSYGLITKIVEHGLLRGWWKPGDVIGDPFGGVGLGGIVCAYHGLRWVGCELEPRFVELANRNFDLHRRRWQAVNDPEPAIILGDSRRFAELVGGCCGIVSSPPYAEGMGHGGAPSRGDGRADDRNLDGMQNGYGSTPGQIGAMKAGSVSAILTSPPYAETPIVGPNSGACSGGIGKQFRLGNRPKGAASDATTGYGSTDGQIGAMKAGSVDAIVSSPPYADRLAQVSKNGIGSTDYGDNGHAIIERRTAWAALDHEAFAAYLSDRRAVLTLSKAEVDRRLGTNTVYSFYEGRRGSTDQWRIPLPSTYRKLKEVLKLDDRFDDVLLSTEMVEVERRAMKMGHTIADYGSTDGNLGNLPAGTCDGVISSPPYEGTQIIGGDQVNRSAIGKGVDLCKGARFEDSKNYIGSPGQIGNTNGDTYWGAAKAVYEQMRLAMKPGGIACIVVKDYIKGGKRVPLCDDTMRLLEHLGFTPVERIRAMLVKETNHEGLFGTVTKTKERKSFFRRLAEKKGSPRIDWEEVLIVRS
jgi:DNA modification methylase